MGFMDKIFKPAQASTPVRKRDMSGRFMGDKAAEMDFEITKRKWPTLSPEKKRKLLDIEVNAESEKMGNR